ncbi:hypothetical protein [Hydrogenophaga sp.]|uniref:hypothetical protein n=1 Tax=Hydrogenophaga sp. TaxID=1904254 RepID=UPI0035B371D0
MTILASDNFTGVGTSSIGGRTLNNALGGTASAAWESEATVNFLGNGADQVARGTNNSNNWASLSGANVTRITIAPNGVNTPIVFAGLRLAGPTLREKVVACLATSQTALAIRTYDSANNPTTRATTVITAPVNPVILEVKIEGLVVTANLYNASDSSLIATTNWTATTLPTGNYAGFGFLGAANATITFDNFVADDGSAGDVTAPTLTSATATATGATTATGGVTTDEAGPAWAVLTTSSTTPSAAQIKAGQNHTGAAASASATATLAVGANASVFSFTGLTAGQTYWEHVVQDDAVPNTSTPITSASSVTTPTPDTTSPEWPGGTTLGASNKTDTTVTLTASADATDNVAVAGYEWSSDDGASYPFTSLTKTFQFTALSALNSYQFKSRAYDAAGNKSAAISLTTSTYRAGDTAANILANTGPVGGNPAGFLYAFASTVTSTDWLSYTITSGPTPSGGTLTANPDGTFTYFGPEPATLVIQPEVNGANAAETITVTLYDQTGEVPDTDPPVLSAATAYASSATTAAGTVTTNEATGTLYFLRNNSATATDVAVKAGLSQAVTAAGIQTVNVTGLTASTPGNYIHYLHRDAAGNDSLVSSSAAFTTPAPPAPGMKVTGAKPTKVSARPIARPIAGKPTD